MIQAARSGKQNILEGSQVRALPKKWKLSSPNVARASLEELLEDCRDYLRVRRLEEWTKEGSIRK